MAEFAIVVPILLLVLLGIMQLGVVYNNWVTLTDAARAGARKAAVCRSGCSPNASTATVNAVKNSAANLNQAKLERLRDVELDAGLGRHSDRLISVVGQRDGRRRRLRDDVGNDHRTCRIARSARPRTHRSRPWSPPPIQGAEEAPSL